MFMTYFIGCKVSNHNTHSRFLHSINMTKTSSFITSRPEQMAAMCRRHFQVQFFFFFFLGGGGGGGGLCCCFCNEMFEFWNKFQWSLPIRVQSTISESQHWHYSGVIMSAMTSKITGVSNVCSNVYSGADQRIHQSSASLVFVREIHGWPVDSPHKGPVTRKRFPFDDVSSLAHIYKTFVKLKLSYVAVSFE